MRKSEFLSSDNKLQKYALRWKDIQFLTEKGSCASNVEEAWLIRIILRGSKTDQYGKGEIRQLTKSGSSWFCPVRAAWALQEHAQSISASKEDSICTISKDTTLNSKEVARAIKAAVFVVVSITLERLAGHIVFVQVF